MNNIPVIQLQNVNIYQGSNLVISKINLEINRGEFVYLTGKTGSGKSSILKTLYADIELIEGEGRVVGYDLKKIKNKEIPFLRRKLGVVFQDFQLLRDRTVAENLIFVMRATGWNNINKIKAKIKEVLDKVEIFDKENKLPYQLSGGEQQRVAIARALINNPEIILADEPTGNLDPEISDKIVKILNEISMNGKAVIMATHDYKLMEKFKFKTLKCENNSLLQVV